MIFEIRARLGLQFEKIMFVEIWGIIGVKERFEP